MDLSRTVIFFHTRVFCAPPPLKGFPWNLVPALGVKKLATELRMKLDDIFSHLDTIHECDRQTDRQTPADSKDRAYA